MELRKSGAHAQCRVYLLKNCRNHKQIGHLVCRDHAKMLNVSISINYVCTSLDDTWKFK